MSTSLADVRTKIDLIKHDSCFTGDAHTKYPACSGRYLTQLDNTVQVAQDEAQKMQGGARVNPFIGAVTSKIGDFHSSSCDTSSGDPNRCAADLEAINANLDKLGSTLDSLAPSPT